MQNKGKPFTLTPCQVCQFRFTCPCPDHDTCPLLALVREYGQTFEVGPLPKQIKIEMGKIRERLMPALLN